MGSRNSKSNSGGKNIQESNIQTNYNQNLNSFDVSTQSLDNSIDNTSNYKGINITNQKQKSDNYNSDQITQEKTPSDIYSGLYFNIIWKYGGNNVIIAGSFGGWKQYKMKKKISEKIEYFEKEIPIPNITTEKYQFKFIVDDDWKFSDDYPKIKDENGFINNYIDNIYVNEHLHFLKDKNNEAMNSYNDINFKNFLNLSKDNSSKEINKSSYGNIYPNEFQFNQEAPKMPDVLDVFTSLSENSKQGHLGKKKYLKYSPMNLCTSYKNIFPPGHQYINHLLFNTYIKSNKLQKKEKKYDDKFAKINCNIKAKGKCLSILYLSPLNG